MAARRLGSALRPVGALGARNLDSVVAEAQRRPLQGVLAASQRRDMGAPGVGRYCCCWSLGRSTMSESDPSDV